MIERQERLQFECQCVACENRYPLYDELTKGTIPRFTRPEHVVSDSYVDYINRYAFYYPCQELVQAETDFRFYLDSSYAGASMEMRSKYSAF